MKRIEWDRERERQRERMRENISEREGERRERNMRERREGEVAIVRRSQFQSLSIMNNSICNHPLGHIQ